ncbi:THAP2 [Lepeophtheirus salmonis]|uniref:THAP2 n=1 Tax=Lepeophtheirus salmonis TaxID=72036 RepID=A0A7R8D4S9_LEPSM|nr:THAP2 [Lepeophtheirus salmonis]CAF3028600.1 THAP2 [Lepeophtheirus salmonis]
MVNKVCSHRMQEFPKDQILREKWIRNLSRKNYTPSSHSVLCSKHFDVQDFEQQYLYQNPKELNSKNIKCSNKLKQGSVPSKFPNLPKETKMLTPSRSERATSSARHQRQLERLNTQAKDQVSMIKQEGKLYLITIGMSKFGTQELSFSLEINEDLSFTACVNGFKLKKNRFGHILKTNTFEHLFEVINLVAFLKSPDVVIPDFKEKEKKSLSFLNEQLSLCVIPYKQSRRYSSSLISIASNWKETSPKLYRKFLQEDLLSLPCERYLKQLNSNNPLPTKPGLEETTEQMDKEVSFTIVECGD